MEKRIDLMHQCVVALSDTLIDTGLDRFGGALRYGKLEITIAMNDVEPHEESVRFVETLVLHLRERGVYAAYERQDDCHNVGDNTHPYNFVVLGDDGDQQLLPIAARCICRTAGRRISVLHVVLG